MKNSQTIGRIVGLVIALAITLPVSAAEEDVPRYKGYAAAHSTAAKTTSTSLTGEAQQAKDSAPETATKKKESTSDPVQMPYVTYDGAANAPSDR